MPADFQLTFTDTFLTEAASQIFPEIGPKLQQTQYLSDQKLTLTWAVASPPQFVFTGQVGPQTFSLNIELNASVTPDGKSPESADAQAAVLVKASIDGTGTLSMRVASIKFTSDDALLLGVLKARQADVAEQINELLGAIAPTLSIVDGITFHGFAMDIGCGVAGMAASVDGDASNDTLTPPSTDFALTIRQPLVQTLVQQNWWNTVPKTYGASGANISLNGYNVAVAQGQIQLTFYLGGTYSIGSADWNVQIDPVTATLNVSVDADRNVKLSSAGTTTPGVALNPDNWEADLFDIGLGLIGVITTAIISDVIGSEISGSIDSQLNQTMMQIPVLSGGFDGVTITVTPIQLALGGSGDELVVTGNGAASAG